MALLPEIRYAILPSMAHVLPALVQATINTVVCPRPNTLIAAVAATESRPDLRNIGQSGEPVAIMNVCLGDYHLVPQVGYQTVVSNANIAHDHDGVNPLTVYRATGSVQVEPHHTTASVLAHIWGATATVYGLQRVLPARVIGEIGPSAELGWLRSTTGFYYVDPTVERQFLITELDGTGVRIVPFNAFVREFSCLAELVGDIIGTLPSPTAA